MTSAEPIESDYEDLADPNPPRSHVNRAVAICLFVPTLSVLLLAAFLTPSEEGMGTHTQLGLPPCGFEVATGYPCATCGCTTAFAHAANGSLLDSFLTQPFGFVLALFTAMTVIVTGYAAITDMPLAPIGRLLIRGPVIGGMIGLLMVSWGYLMLVHH